MSKRRELVRHIDSLTDIGELLGAMRSLALAESRRIATFIDAQRDSATIVRQAYAQVLHDHGHHWQQPAIHGRVVCVIGTERGFCGDLNQRLVADALGTTADTEATRWLLIGTRLADAWPADAPTPEARLGGAGMADEVLAVQTALVAALTPCSPNAPTPCPHWSSTTRGPTASPTSPSCPSPPAPRPCHRAATRWTSTSPRPPCRPPCSTNTSTWPSAASCSKPCCTKTNNASPTWTRPDATWTTASTPWAAAPTGRVRRRSRRRSRSSCWRGRWRGKERRGERQDVGPLLPLAYIARIACNALLTCLQL
ncbi:F0F1 ATP synthase subunit gamma [Nitrogeniibacter mangrovi]|uniref:F0F1 ATP synthase subunit gamma n=1 Tax=Nitrogeniibacter mangrovi TaxID=2016596 RepID=A0A6C1B7Z0_9RHOO|nr:F0F1 ATP synthase subunit gamma [Nitrogeniibacter mangrovi]